jgi:hypothetical protein
MGYFDYKAAVNPSIAGKMDIEKKQGMDLFQLLINLPFVDPRKLTSKVLHSWNWNLDSVSKAEQEAGPQIGPDGQPIEVGAGMPPGLPPEPGGQLPTDGGPQMPSVGSGDIPQDVIKSALGLIGGGGGQTPFGEASSPINLLKSGGTPPTAAGIKPGGATTNPRGANRGGKVNTNIAINDRSTPEGNLLNQAANIQS